MDEPEPAQEDVELSYLSVSNSSPLAPSSRGSTRPRKPPPITPRRFKRFFNPRCCTPSRSGNQLRDITLNGANRRPGCVAELEFEDIVAHSNKKQRLSRCTPPLGSSPLPSSPLDHLSANSSRSRCVRVVPIRASNVLKSLEAGTNPRHAGRFAISSYSYDEQWSTSRFYSSPEDFYSQSQGVPFCTAACNTNSLVAIGDEQGMLHLLDSTKNSKAGFDKAFMKIPSHKNAIMDMVFSSNDSILVTSSGDQTSEILDMRTQKVLCTMRQHTSSVKQAKFQPGNDSIIATCSRDGSVAIWDLRGRMNPVLALANSTLDVNNDTEAEFSPSGPKSALPGRDDATTTVLANQCLPSSLIPFTHEHHVSNQFSGYPSRASVTSLAFMSERRSHLLLTASEASSVIKLWDVRGKYKSNYRRNTISSPVSSTPALSHHAEHRHYGVTSLAIGTDGSRLYSVCRDNTVYVYSTNHLILGSASEFSENVKPRFSLRRGVYGDDKPALGPLYGFRNPKFHASSFYVRSSIRTENASHGELLAVGSSDGCPVLFSTDERTFLKRSSREPARRQAWCSPGLVDKRRDLPINTPIYNHGTPLVRGHSAEVTGLTWSNDGELVSVSDDRLVRCWREEDSNLARDLRTGGERDGRRWGFGWADVEANWDEEEG